MKKTVKTGKLIRSRMIFRFKKHTRTVPCSGSTIDPTTLTTTTTG